MKKFIPLICFLSISMSVQAQNKCDIAYANMELILLYMPETKVMETQLSEYQKKLAAQLSAMQNEYESVLADYEKSKQSGQQTDELENRAIQLQNRMQDFQKKAEQDLLEKRSTLMEPIVEKLDKVLREVRLELGYTYIINSVDGSGVSVVLSAPEELNLTEVILKRLGVSAGK